MIIPIGHDHSIRQWPQVTIGIIVLCTLVQIWSSFLAPEPADLLPRAIAIAAEYDTPDGSEPTPEKAAELERRLNDLVNELPMQRLGYRTGTGISLALITSAFAHGGWLHLIGNMLFLWLAGSALEDRYGRMRFALFYVLGAVGATYAFEATAEKGILLVGASGAVSACMGAFLLHFHRAQIRFWYLLMYRSGTFHLAAWVALPLWLGEQFLWASLDSVDGKTTGVAYAAHIGGFALGLAMGFAMSKLFPEDAQDDDVYYKNDSADTGPPGRPSQRKVDPGVEERLTKTYDAIDKRDATSARTLGSRVILDLARNDDDTRIVEVYQALARTFKKAPLTVGAFAAAAGAADRLRDYSSYVAIADSMIAEHPLGTDTPKVMWRLAQVHGDQGNHEGERATLTALAKRFPRDEHGKKAAKSLDA